MFDVFKSVIKSSYSISDNASFSSGGWKVHMAKHRLSGKKVSVFIFDKSKFEAEIYRFCAQSSTFNAKIIVEDTLRVLKSEVSQLTRLKHPQILSVVESLQETKLKLMFVTEPVRSTLEQLPKSSEYKPLFLKGLYEVAKGLQFLHKFCSIVHHDLQPSSVFVTGEGDWKLGGFKFLQPLKNLTDDERENYTMMNATSLVSFTNLNFDFTAPELVVEGISPRLGTANDMWSLMMLIFWLYNNGNQLINCLEKSSISDYKAEFRNLDRKLSNVHANGLHFLLKDVPESFWNDSVDLMAKNPIERMTVDEFLSLNFFKGSFIKVMLTLDELLTKPLSEKIAFLDDLFNDSTLVHDFLSSCVTTKLISTFVSLITNELGMLKGQNDDLDRLKLISLAIKLVFMLGSSLSSMSFMDRIFTPLFKSIKPLKDSVFMRLVESSPLVRFAIISNIDTLLAKLPSSEVAAIMKDMAEPCLTYCHDNPTLDSDQIALQNEYLSKLNLVASKFDYLTMTQTIVPLLCKVFKTTTVLSTKLATISSFEFLVNENLIEKALFEEQILPVLENLKSRNKEIIAGVLSLFLTLLFQSKIKLETEEAIDKVLCQCLRLAFGCTDCDKDDFQNFLKQIGTIQSHISEQKAEKLPGSVPTLSGFNGTIPVQNTGNTTRGLSFFGNKELSSSVGNNDSNRSMPSSIPYESPSTIESNSSDKLTTLSWPTMPIQPSHLILILSPSFKPLQPNKGSKIPPGLATYLVLTPKKN